MTIEHATCRLCEMENSQMNVLGSGAVDFDDIDPCPRHERLIESGRYFVEE